jgi:hypothetical protein
VTAGHESALIERRYRMKIDVLTLFPAMFAGPLDESIVKRARDTGLLDLKSTTCATGRTTGTRRWMTVLSAAGRGCC